jgi:DNA invertase Pin-like site-specific DNA recombinase
MNPRRVWLYARVSTRKGSQDQSPAAQIDRLGRAAKLKGWDVVGQGIDRASGAGELPELARALHALNAGTANILGVTDLDRLGGTMRGILETATAIKDLGAHLFVESFQVDTTGPIGVFFFQVLACFSELRRTLQNDKIARGVASARARGVTLGRPIKHVPSKKLIARALELRKERIPPLGWRTVARRLEAEGFKKVPPYHTLRRWPSG